MSENLQEALELGHMLIFYSFTWDSKMCVGWDLQHVPRVDHFLVCCQACGVSRMNLGLLKL